MFKKIPNPKLIVRVDVAIGDGQTAVLEAECRRVGRKEFNAIFTSAKEGGRDADMIGKLITGWNHEAPDSLVDEPYSVDALEQVLDEYWSFGSDFIAAYIKERATYAEAGQKN